LDRLPTWARDLLLMLVVQLAAWAGTDVVPMLRERGPAAQIGAAVLVLVINAVTPLSRSYNLGGATMRDQAVRKVGT
jgi:hypothetical protein